jgi:hypothetical protein
MVFTGSREGCPYASKSSDLFFEEHLAVLFVVETSIYRVSVLFH